MNYKCMGIKDGVCDNQPVYFSVLDNALAMPRIFMTCEECEQYWSKIEEENGGRDKFIVYQSFKEAQVALIKRSL